MPFESFLDAISTNWNMLANLSLGCNYCNLFRETVPLKRIYKNYFLDMKVVDMFNIIYSTRVN
jgi:hypothetical protein